MVKKIRRDNMVRILGSSAHAKDDREKLDFYATDPQSLELFLDAIESDDDIVLDQNIWENACGDGSLSQVLTKHGYSVFSTDIEQRGNSHALMDFTKDVSVIQWEGDILTNPPYSHAENFVRNSLSVIKEGNYVIMFLRLQFIEGQRRRKLYKEFPPKYIYVHSARQMTYKNNRRSKKKSSAVCFAWFIWVTGFIGDPILRWI